MATVQEAIRRMTIVTDERGTTETTRKLQDLSKAQDAVTVSEQRKERAQQSAARSLDSIQRQYDKTYAAQQRLQKIETDLNRARAQGLVSIDRQRELMRLAERQINGTAAANDNFGKATAAANLALGRMGISLTPGLGLLGAIGVAFGAAAVSSKQAIDAFAQFEEQNLALGAVLKATGFAAGKTSDDIEKLAGDIGNISEVRKAAQELLVFRGVAGEAFDRTLRLADDLSAAGFGTISTAAQALGRALENPVEGLSRLRRVGIQFSDAQVAVIRNLQETGRMAEAQRQVLDEIEKRIGGTGAARDAGLTGAYEALGDATLRLLERWGRQIVEGTRLTEVIHGIAGAMNRTNQATVVNPFGDIDRRIGVAQGTLEGLEGRGGSIASQARRRAEAELNKLYEERAAIQRRVAEESAKAAEEQARVTSAAAIAAQERQAEAIKGVVDQLGRETEALKLNAYQRAVDVELRKAQIAPGSAGAAEIERAVNTKLATEATVRSTDAIQAQIDALRIEEATIGKTAAAAAEYRAVQTVLAKAKRDGITLSEDYIAKLREEAALLGKGTGGVERAREVEAANVDRARQISQALEHGARSFIDGMVQGKSAAEAVLAAVNSISSSLTSIGTGSLGKSLESLLKGGPAGFDPASLAIGAAGPAVGVCMSLFASEQESSEQEKPAHLAPPPATPTAERVDNIGETDVCNQLRAA